MREIKFRAWDKENKRMLGVCVLNQWLNSDGGYDKKSEFWALDRKFPEHPALFLHEVELMQFTGLLDKNGVEVFEGDIVQLGDTIRKVFWLNGAFCLTGVSPDYNAVYSLSNIELNEQARETLQIEKEIDVTVIGNIYSNPELLNTKV